jgi:hypothetical protein
VKNEKEQTEGNNCSFSEKESFFLNARERIFVRFAPFVCPSERERERKRETKKTRFTPAKSVQKFRRSPSFSSS